MPDASDPDSSGTRPTDTVVQSAPPAVAPPGAAAPRPAPPGYDILAEVGRGGMGVVYRARDLALNRDVAVKVLQERFPADGAAARQFVAEAQITGQLVHPGVPPIHQIGHLPDGRPFLVMKLIKGQTLDALLADAARPRLLAIFQHLCEAVAYAHSRGVIHRDLKPSNVMVGAFGEVQVMDWGLAKVLGSADGGAGNEDPIPPLTPHSQVRVPHAEETQAGSVMGTPGYMPPEQAGGEVGRIDRRADVFALGGVLCAVLTGRGPYSGRTAQELHLKAVRGQTDEARAALAGCGADPGLVALCLKCLSADPNARPPDAGAVAAAVRPFVAPPARPGLPRPSRRAALVAFGSVGLAGAAAGGYFAFRPRPEVPPGPPEPDPDEPPKPVLVRVPSRDLGAPVRAITISDDARFLAVALGDDEHPDRPGGVKLFDRAAGDAPAVWWRWQEQVCREVSFAPDGKRLAVAAGDRVRVLNLGDGHEIELPGASVEGAARGVAFSPDGRWLAAALQPRAVDGLERAGLVRLWDASKLNAPRELRRTDFPVRGVAFSGDGAFLAAAMTGKPNDWVPTVEVWRAADGGHLKSLDAPLTVGGPHVAFARRGAAFAVSDREAVKVYAAPGFADPGRGLSPPEGEPCAVALSADGAVVAFAADVKVYQCDVAEHRARAEHAHASAVTALAFALDGSVLLAGGAGGTVHEWEAARPT